MKKEKTGLRQLQVKKIDQKVVEKVVPGKEVLYLNRNYED